MTKQDSAWQRAVIYQVYPWTFFEDAKRKPQHGLGSIKGITAKLSYIRDELGADVIWLTPFHPSPMVDGGYDISDFLDVHPDLGKLKEIDELIKEAHKADLKIIMDFVPNHTSDQHEWFQKSRKKQDDYDDWYIWHPGKEEKRDKKEPPNNWASYFSIPNRRARERGEIDIDLTAWTPPVSAWQWDDERGEYYMRTFAKEQPDLNWSNPAVREAMKDVMRFWLDRGMDGFRVDVVNHLGKNMDFPDEEINTAYTDGDNLNPYEQLLQYNSSGYMDALHKYIWEICEVLRDDKYDKRDLRLILEAHMGESDLRTLNDIAPDVATAINFNAMNLKWAALERKIQLDYYYETLSEKGIGNQVNGNHDMSRLASRRGDIIARTVATMNFFLPGMRFIYNGEELGLHDKEMKEKDMRDQLAFRDPSRTPMVWDDNEKNAGFSKADEKKLWIPMNDEDFENSLYRQELDPKSSYNLYRTAIKLCKQLPALQSGTYKSLHTDNLEVFAYERRNNDEEKAVVVVNFSPYVQHSVIVTDFAESKTIISSTDVAQHPQDVNLEDGVHLQPNEVLVIVASDGIPLGPKST